MRSGESDLLAGGKKTTVPKAPYREKRQGGLREAATTASARTAVVGWNTLECEAASRLAFGLLKPFCALCDIRASSEYVAGRETGSHLIKPMRI